MVGRRLLRGDATTPDWSSAAEWRLPSRGRKQKVNRVAGRMVSRFNINKNLLLDLLDDAAGSDIAERPADIIDHVMDGIAERKDFNDAAMREMRRTLNNLL